MFCMFLVQFTILAPSLIISLYYTTTRENTHLNKIESTFSPALPEKAVWMHSSFCQLRPIYNQSPLCSKFPLQIDQVYRRSSGKILSLFSFLLAATVPINCKCFSFGLKLNEFLSLHQMVASQYMSPCLFV